MLTEQMSVKESEKGNALGCRIFRPEKDYQFSVHVVNWEGPRITRAEMFRDQWSMWS